MTFLFRSVVLLLAVHVGQTQFLKVPSSCTGLKCENNGRLRTDGARCACQCPQSYTGLQCEIELKESEWPDGPYATPMPIYGCPEEAGKGWRTGNINMTFMEMVNQTSAVAKATKMNLLGPFAKYVIQLNFCFKTADSAGANRSTVPWPNGRYSIYRGGDKCPGEFEEQELRMELPPLLRLNTVGYLPSFDVERYNESAVLRIKICDRVGPVSYNRSDPGWTSPFILLPGGGSVDDSKPCPQFAGVEVRAKTLNVVSTHVTHCVNNTKVETHVDGFKYCLYKTRFRKANELVESFKSDLAGIKRKDYLIPFRTVRTSRSLEKLYRDYPLTAYSGTREAFFERKGEFRSAKTPMGLFLKGRGVPWVLIDLEETVNIDHIQLVMIHFTDKVWNWTYGEIPKVALSNKRWAFLRNGALTCGHVRREDQLDHTLMQDCAWPTPGRYVSIYGKGNTAAPGKTASFFMSLKEVKVFGKGRGCGKHMGMRDFGIDEFQLSASSSRGDNQPHQARPHLAGWCALTTDPDPYFQVDLLVATIIEGIKIYNWMTTINSDQHGVYTTTHYPTGAQAFRLEHGFSEDSLTVYNISENEQTFRLDLSLPYHHEESFLLESPIMASLIRVRPVGFQVDDFSATCLRFELVGCRQAKLKTVQCLNKTETFWTKRSEVFVSVESYYHTESTDSDNLTDCRDQCGDCDAYTYGEDTNTTSCLLFRFSDVANFRRVTNSSNTVASYQKSCIYDPVVLPLTAFNVSSNRFAEVFPDELLTEITTESAFTSLGYPFSYDTGIVSKWHIDVGVKGKASYSQLYFTNISLNVYESSEDWYTYQLCEDTIVILIHDTTVESHLLALPGDLDQEKSALATINSTMNDKQVDYTTQKRHIEINFQTCTRESELTFRGSGFRAIVKLFANPSRAPSLLAYECTTKTFEVNRYLNLVSNSFNGLEDSRYRFEYFAICLSLYYVNLTVTYLEVTCEEFTALEVTDSYINVFKYCNLNRPMTSIISERGIIWVRLHYGRSEASPGIQGFRAMVDSTPYTTPVNDTFREVHYTESVAEWEKVCVNRTGKCYGIYRNTYFGILHNGSTDFLSANKANTKCAELLGSVARLVSIRSEWEARFIITELALLVRPRQVTEALGIGMPKTIYDYVYIGLTWDTDYNGTLKAIWRDGYPMTYTAWPTGQPSGQLTKQCTRMGIYSLNTFNTWENIDCDALAAEYLICEVDMNDPSAKTEKSHRQLVNMTWSGELADTYRYLHCGTGEVVSRLYVCDGVKDCLDGSDELHCAADGQEGTHAKFFKCANGDVIPISMTCDHLVDCADKSDERCVFRECSNREEFRCRNFQCIPRSYVCNYRRDCWDGSDEMQCETCSNDTFRCSDLSCIPFARKCDGFFDCPDLLDESNCKTKSMDSCVEWWKDGHTETGVYTVRNTKVLCNFDVTPSEGLIQTMYYNIQVRKAQSQYVDVNASTSLLTYENQDFVSAMMKTLDCSQSLIQTCEPPADEIDEMETLFGLRQHRPCMCLRLIWTRNSSRVELCSNAQNQTVDPQWLLQQGRIIAQERSLPITLLDPIKPEVGKEWLKVEPVICNQTVHGSEEGKLLCVKGNTVDAKSRCMYELNSYGDLNGCRDLTHLQNCENVTCPEGYIKCANSFCLSTSLLCDGQRQCPGGEDELNCWCGSQDNVVVIMFDTKGNLDYAAIHLAGQLYNYASPFVSSNIRLVRYTHSTNNRFRFESWSIADTKLDYTTYLPRKINQFSEKQTFSIAHDVSMIPYIKTLEESTPSAIILLQNSISYRRMSTSDIMDFDQSLVGDMKLYVVSLGRDMDFSGTSSPTAFQVRFTAVSFTSEEVIVPLSFGPEVCSEISPQVAPVCPEMYRCHATRQCLIMAKVCDGYRQCPLGDDERLCDFVCPPGCLCNGFEVDCSLNRATPESMSVLSANTKYLDLHLNDFQAFKFEATQLPFLITLNMSRCFLIEIPAVFLQSMRNLLHLDLSYNQIWHIQSTDLVQKYRLLTLDLTGNYELTAIEPRAFRDLNRVKYLAITDSKIDTLVADTMYHINVTKLDLSGNQITTVEDNAFDGAAIENLDITRNRITNFQSGMFFGITSLKTLRTDAYKFCCMRPDSVEESNCYPPRNEFSSCADLMRNEALRFLLWIIGFCALIGNILSLLYRLKFDRKRLKLGYGIFVTNLAVADFMMGIYLVMIAAADLTFRGRYIEMDDWWRNSAWCGLAGVLATMSSEASVLFMCLITIDRIIVIKYPFGEFRFTTKLALIASAITWVVIVNIATVPLWFTYYFEDQFYSRSGVCLALPLTRDKPPGWAYSTTIFVGFNFLAFVLIAIGQFLIYREVQASSNRMKKTTANRQSDLKVARNLLLVVSTDFLCWFPIGVMGMMALRGHVVSSVVYAWAAVLILPVNSALNPFLYTFSAIIGSKKFSPSTDEQATTVFYPKGVLDNIVNIWDKKMFCQKSGKRRGHRSLKAHLSVHTLTPHDALKIAIRLAQGIEYLHSSDLVHGELSSQFVFCKLHNELVRDATMKVSPSLATRSTETRKDIEGMGQIISEILRKLSVND